MSQALAIRSANQVEAIADHDDACVWSIRIDQCDSEQRRLLIDHHDAVMRLLRQRGRRVRAQTVHQDDGSYLTIRIVSGPAWRTQV